jgi:hypothetical protein
VGWDGGQSGVAVVDAPSTPCQAIKSTENKQNGNLWVFLSIKFIHFPGLSQKIGQHLV